jgi:hypothetical protein
MDYKTAVKNLFRKKEKKRSSNPFYILKNLPKGWIYLPRNGGTTKYYDNRSSQEIAEFAEALESDRKQQIANQYVDKFIRDTVFGLQRDGCTDEEIDYFILHMFDADENEVFESSDEEDYASDDSGYSDN